MAKNVIQRENDPFIYLYVSGINEWFCYNPYEPPLGKGAMGDVYLGYRIKNGAEIAVKKVKDFYANNRMIRERARQEASLAFRHPNLVEMIGCCESAPDSGSIFILSNLVRGENIDKYVKNFDNSPNRVEKISHAIMAILDALDYIHSRGVIHRDIKPSNIMVENDSNIRLMDLGISRMNGGNKFSSFGFIGTPQYSAPEQIKRGEGNIGDPINATTDIYELGITFYELLTGENPMDAQSEADTLDRQIKKTLPPNQKIPSKLMKVIWKATEKEQAKRYQTALDFKKAISDALLPEPSFSERLSRFMQDNIAWIMIIAVIIAGLIFFLVIMTS